MIIDVSKKGIGDETVNVDENLSGTVDMVLDVKNSVSSAA